jgi:hypothetical protein
MEDNSGKSTLAKKKSRGQSESKKSDLYDSFQEVQHDLKNSTKQKQKQPPQYKNSFFFD